MSPLPALFQLTSIAFTPDLQRARQEAALKEKDTKAKEVAWTNFPKDLMVGALMGGVAHTLVAPVERAKLLLQTQDSNMVVMDGKHPRYKGLMDCIVRIAKNEGVLSLWRGNISSVLRYYPSLAINFAFKDFYRALLTSGGVQGKGALANAPANFLAGALAGCTSLVFVYPLDIAHTRIAADIGRGTSRQFQGLTDFLRTIYRKDGIRGVYRGFPASVHGMVVHRSVYFGGFDTAKEYLSQDTYLSFWKRWMIAQGVTTSAGLISYPLDTVRRRMMMQAGSEKNMYNSTWDCWKKMYRHEGVMAFYKGAVTNLVRGTGAALILFLQDKQLYSDDQILKAKIELLAKTNMVDYAVDIHKSLYHTEDVPQEMVDRRVEVVGRLKVLEESTVPLISFLQNPALVQELRSDKQYNLQMLQERYQIGSEQIEALY